MPLTTKIYFKTIFFKNFSGTLTLFQYFSISDIFMHANIYLPLLYALLYYVQKQNIFFFSKKFCFFNSWTKKCKRSFSMFLCTFTYGIQIFMQHIIPAYITIIFIKYSTKYCDLELNNEYLSCSYYYIQYLLKKTQTYSSSHILILNLY